MRERKLPRLFIIEHESSLSLMHSNEHGFSPNTPDFYTEEEKKVAVLPEHGRWVEV